MPLSVRLPPAVTGVAGAWGLEAAVVMLLALQPMGLAVMALAAMRGGHHSGWEIVAQPFSARPWLTGG